MRLAGWTCLITGASRGFGRHLAQRCWADGASLWLVARTDIDLSEYPSRPGQSVVSCVADLATVSGVDRVACFAPARLDVLVHNAAVIEGDWPAVLALNLLAPMQLSARLQPHLTAASGAIVTLSGGGATQPLPGLSAYAASKAGLVRFMETLAMEWATTGVVVNCLAPGVLPTPMAQGRTADDGAMDRAADCALWLMTQRWMTGRLVSAAWDDWRGLLPTNVTSDRFTLRRVCTSG